LIRALDAACDGYEKKVDQDLLARLDNGTVAVGAANSTLTMGVIAAGRAVISGNATLLAGLRLTPTLVSFIRSRTRHCGCHYSSRSGGRYDPVSSSALFDEILRNSLHWQTVRYAIITDGQPAIDSSDDTKGGVFATGQNGAIIFVNARNTAVD